MKKVRTLLIFSFLLLTFSLSAQTQQKQPPQYRQEPSPVEASLVKGSIYEVKGGEGANCGFFVGEKEVLIIDAKMTKESAQEMIAAIRKITSLPLRYMILTHSDGDHVNGLVGFSRGINIIAHHHTRNDMEEAFKDPEQRIYLPEQTFSRKLSLYLTDKKIELSHFGPAHTNGDVVVYFSEDKVAFLGDLYFRDRDPLIHRHKNGNSFGLVKTLKAVLELDADTFVHGHGDIASREDIQVFIGALESKQMKIKAMIDKGRTLDQIKKAFDVEDRPTQPGGRRWLSLVEVIYLELAEEKVTLFTPNVCTG